MVEFFTRAVIVEKGTVLHLCAIDSGMRYESVEDERDMLKYVADNTDIWLEYLAFVKANRKAIDKEVNDRYRL